MLPKKLNWLLGLALMVAVMFCFQPPAFAEWHLNVGGQSSPVESVKSSNPSNFSYELSHSLNENRDEIGRNILSLIHPNQSYYDYTEPILMAEKPGNRLVFEIPIHWHRDFVAIQRNHLTRIRWSIGNHHHLKAEVASDNSSFHPTHLNQMNDSLRLLLKDD
ncbi:MAG: hypothetical protein SWJ54_06970 [Cyanobacteriota bacterium]|nr:hypothetical protein [Cyanobacteriota bacterium]